MWVCECVCTIHINIYNVEGFKKVISGIRQAFTGIRMFLPMVSLAFQASGRKTIECMDVILARVILR